MQVSLCRSHCNGCVKVASYCGCIGNTIVFCSWISEIVLEWLHEGCEMDLLADFLHFGTSVFLLHVGLEQWEVWGVKSAVWSVRSEGSSGKWKVWSVECEVSVWSAKSEVWSVRFGVWRKQWEVWSVKCGVWSVECEVSVWGAKSVVWSVKFEVWSAKSAVWSMECEVWNLECEECNVKCGVWRLYDPCLKKLF